ncbi:hypothetical protein TWF481_007490 [Arthrobotrys musiformis]|uniref:Uncharacterized protein n=1 Tax=Arthrobotrys musiformis TaxID=47236 RepID=A0AAV9WBT5_9PEZI
MPLASRLPMSQRASSVGLIPNLAQGVPGLARTIPNLAVNLESTDFKLGGSSTSENAICLPAPTSISTLKLPPVPGLGFKSHSKNVAYGQNYQLSRSLQPDNGGKSSSFWTISLSSTRSELWSKIGAVATEDNGKKSHYKNM